MESLLESKKVITIEPIFAELLYGSRSDKEKNVIISYWKVLPRIKFIEGSFIEAANFANKSNYHNLGIGLIDTILSKSVIDNKYLIWTLDKKILNNLDKKFIFKS
jgi:predicted nucleic acid-binding protein